MLGEQILKVRSQYDIVHVVHSRNDVVRISMLSDLSQNSIVYHLVMLLIIIRYPECKNSCRPPQSHELI